jgi:uncharacterized spore protein YtfJ
MANEEFFERMFAEFGETRKQASVDAVFGTPVESNGHVVIPIASTIYGYGFGGGMNERKETASSHAGGGGGSGYRTRPAAIAVIEPDGVHIKTIENSERIAIAGILMGMWSVFWSARVLMRLISRKKS